MHEQHDFLKALGIEAVAPPCASGLNWFGSTVEQYESHSPVDGQKIGAVGKASLADYEQLIQIAEQAKGPWASMPAPKRGEIVRQMGNALREAKA
ncbi:MAG: aldehyde dehydrogenase family protein, partial [Candidatus Melainabacteria bacterium HGW-Melainabacteria-1]